MASGEVTRLSEGDLEMDLLARTVHRAGCEITLQSREFRLLECLLGHRGQVMTRTMLLEKVWELPNHPNTRVVDNVIVALRKAFEENSWRPRHIHSVRGAGYRFVP